MDASSNHEPHYEDRSPRAPSYWLIALTGVVLGAVVALIGVLLLLDDERAVDTTGTTTTVASTATSAVTVPTSSTATTTTTTTTTASTSSSASTTTTTTTATTTSTSSPSSSSTSTVPDPYLSAVWPWPASSVRYTDPVDAARGFAEDFIGFSNPRAGPFMQSDARSGAVEVEPRGNGPVTIVFVRRLGPEGDWWVLGATTDNIRIDEPEHLNVLDNPLTVSGAAHTFESHVDLVLRADGSLEPVIEGVVTGGGTEMLPFEETFTWTKPDVGAGALMLFNRSALDGEVWEASVVRVLFD